MQYSGQEASGGSKLKKLTKAEKRAIKRNTAKKPFKEREDLPF